MHEMCSAHFLALNDALSQGLHHSISRCVSVGAMGLFRKTKKKEEKQGLVSADRSDAHSLSTLESGVGGASR
jgi:hypothetical protein